MDYGYHVGGLAFMDPAEAISQLARLGYQCVAIRPHSASLNPNHPWFGQHVDRISESIRQHNMKVIIDLDGLFLLDPYQRRLPSFLDADSDRYELLANYLTRWLQVAKDWSAELMTISTGSLGDPGRGREESLDVMAERLNPLLDQMADGEVGLAIRPRVGDFVDSIARFNQLQQWISSDSRSLLCLAADVGEMLSAGEIPVVDRLQMNLDALGCVYLCDRSSQQDGDVPPGSGEVALDRIVKSLRRIDFRGAAIVRVDGHSDDGLVHANSAIDLFT